MKTLSDEAYQPWLEGWQFWALAAFAALTVWVVLPSIIDWWRERRVELEEWRYPYSDWPADDDWMADR